MDLSNEVLSTEDSSPKHSNDITTAWNTVIGAFKFSSSDSTHTTSVSTEEFAQAICCIHKCGLGHVIKPWFLNLFDEELEIVVAQFWQKFDDVHSNGFRVFPKAVDEMYQRIHHYYTAIAELQVLQDDLQNDISEFSAAPHQSQTTLDEVLELLRGLLLISWPANFRSVLIQYYNMIFKIFQTKQKNSGDSSFNDSKGICHGCESEFTACCCDEYLSEFHVVNKQMYEVQLLDHILRDVPISVVQDNVEKHIKEMCSGSFDVSYLPILKNWIEETVLKWLSTIYVGAENDTHISKLLDGYKDRLMHALYDAYAYARFDQLFNVIIEYPESQAALEDLRECVNIAGLRTKLITSLRKTMVTRLLHPGVNTSDILTAYISSIKALRVLDSSGVVLQLVCEPVCQYLRTREDTVRCIVFSLTDESCEDLTSELMKGSPLLLEDNCVSDEENENWETWTPDPVDADPAKTAKTQRSSDIISMLVSIYGSKELFVNEYRTLLADRLLSSFSYNTEREIRYLELLKLRFGESHLHYCEVMLKDIADSRRINLHLNCDDLPHSFTKDFPVNAMILSAQFWPPFKEEKLKLPDCIWDNVKRYTTAFETLKGNRTLAWKPHLGSVILEIELKERTLELSVSPVHATILIHFQEKPQWTIEELSSVMQIQASVLRRKITFWQSHGILKEVQVDHFILVEDQPGSSHESVVMIEEEAESVTASSHDQREEELQTFWSFIVGMLTNMESLPLDRIHSMLKMFAMQGPTSTDFDVQCMKQFLDKKVQERKLLYSGGLYRLPKFES